jgi:hypothetical protein
MNSQPVHCRWKSRQWVFHQLVHWGLKYKQLASPLEIEIKTVGVPLAGPLRIEIWAAGRSIGN